MSSQNHLPKALMHTYVTALPTNVPLPLHSSIHTSASISLFHWYFQHLLQSSIDSQLLFHCESQSYIVHTQVLLSKSSKSR